MGLIQNLNKWANSRTNLGIDLMRIGLGGFLFFKGIEFEANAQSLVELIRAENPAFASMFMVHYVAMSHFAGGLMIMFGLLTRFAILVQLPIIIGAVLINLTGEMISANFIQALFAFAFSMFFLAYGSGRHSVDYTLKLNA